VTGVQTCALPIFPAPNGEAVEVVVPLPPELELVLERLERLRG
jgi:hypothetical protein